MAKMVHSERSVRILFFDSPHLIVVGPGVDFFSVATCHFTGGGQELAVEGLSGRPGFWNLYSLEVIAAECVSDRGKALCQDISGNCVTEVDGYYVVSAICLLFGLVFLVVYIIPIARKLQGK